MPDLDATRPSESLLSAHPCQRCGSETWTDVDYAGCSDCREPEESPAPLSTLRETFERWVPDGYRDDDGVWHVGPHRRDALASLESVRAVVERYGRVWAKDTDYYAAAEALGIKEPPDA